MAIKRSVQTKIKAKVKAWEHLKSMIEHYHKREDASQILLEALDGLANSLEKAVFEDCVSCKL